MVTENYPNLKANQAFQDLRVQLEGTENRITVARNRYIQTVQEYNVLARSFPTNLTAMMFGYKAKPSFTVQNEAQISVPPTVSFDKPASTLSDAALDALASRPRCGGRCSPRLACSAPACARRTCCRCRPLTGRVIDQTGTLTPAQTQALERQARGDREASAARRS